MIQGFYRIIAKTWEEASPHLNKLLRVLFDRTSPIVKDLQTSAPTTDDLEEMEECEYKSGSTIRKYKKIDGIIYYQDWTAA